MQSLELPSLVRFAGRFVHFDSQEIRPQILSEPGTINCHAGCTSCNAVLFLPVPPFCV